MALHLMLETPAVPEPVKSKSNGFSWKDIPGYEGLYQVSDAGEVKSLSKRGKPELLLKLVIGRGGCPVVWLCKKAAYKGFKVSRLVAAAFLGPAQGRLVRHRNDVCTENHLENLLYGTYKDNMQDAIQNGRTPKGERHGNVKLTLQQVREIKKRLVLGESGKVLSQEFLVGAPTISSIKHEKRWGWA